MLIISVRTLSPPTHDVTQEDKTSGEISRLSSEVTKCLQQIRTIQLQHSLQRGCIKMPTSLVRKSQKSLNKGVVGIVIEKQKLTNFYLNDVFRL